MIKKVMSKTSGLVKVAVFSGLILAAVFGTGLAVLNTALAAVQEASVRERISFQRLLNDYDLKRDQVFGYWGTADAAEAENLSLDLDRLETETKKSESNWLSVLKRRRELANLPGAGPRRLQAYRRSSAKALGDFPFSQSIAAVAASAIALGNVGVEAEEELRRILPRLNATGFVPIRIALHVMLGDFQSPERASRYLLEDGGMSLDFAISAIGHDTEAVLTSLVILRVLEGETREPLFAVQGAAARDGVSDEFIRFAAELVYDFGNPIRSAELFHILPGDEALSRQADAFWLAGYTDLARLTWSGLVNPSSGMDRGGTSWQDASVLEDMALYNLAVTAETEEDARETLSRLTLQGSPGQPYRDLGVIRFTRLLDPRQGIAALEAEKRIRGTDPSLVNSGLGGRLPTNALIDLEILRRRMEMGEAPRIVAETWMLINRNHDLEDLYEWAAWLFTLQRNISETERLILTAERQGFSGSWMATHRALQLIHDGRFDSALRTMETVQAGDSGGDWALSANLGRVLEARGAATRALEHYQTALAMLMETGAVNRHEIASVLHFRIARCLRTIGRTDESRRSLMEAIELNPNNLQARLDLNRM